MIIETIQNRIP